MTQSAIPADTSLALTDVTFHQNGQALIGPLTLTLPRKGTTVIMGPNGAGKSLLLRLAHGLIAPSAGQITWHGQPTGPKTIRQQALVFQKPVLLRRSTAANVDFVLRARGLRDIGLRDEALAQVGLTAQASTPARRLSGGEQQRLALARALVTTPEVLLLDEPTASLDPAATLQIEQIVQDAAARGTRILFVTHDIGQARRLADDVVFLHRGQLAEHSPAHRFFDTPESEPARAYLAGRLPL